MSRGSLYKLSAVITGVAAVLALLIGDWSSFALGAALCVANLACLGSGR